MSMPRINEALAESRGYIAPDWRIARDALLGVPAVEPMYGLNDDARREVALATLDYLGQCSPEEVIELGERVIGLYSRSRTRTSTIQVHDVDPFAYSAVTALCLIGSPEAFSKADSIELARKRVYDQIGKRGLPPVAKEF